MEAQVPIGAIVLVDPEISSDALDGWRDAARDFAAAMGIDVRLMTGDAAALTTLASQLAAHAQQWTAQTLGRGEEPPAAMTAAPIIYREDGRPDWSAMWTSFCELALYGGPPHRGPDDPVVAGAPVATTDPHAGFDAVTEIRRGIFETTGLFSEPAGPGWLAVTCDSRRMAAWMCAAVILENVDARCDQERLLVPADPGYDLADQVKSVITVLAKTHHYWAAHVAATSSGAAAVSA
jgi:hypothetical protein